MDFNNERWQDSSADTKALAEKQKPGGSFDLQPLSKQVAFYAVLAGSTKVKLWFGNLDHAWALGRGGYRVFTPQGKKVNVTGILTPQSNQNW